jgi:hypothetical protein
MYYYQYEVTDATTCAQTRLSVDTTVVQMVPLNACCLCLESEICHQSQLPQLAKLRCLARAQFTAGGLIVLAFSLCSTTIFN